MLLQERRQKLGKKWAKSCWDTGICKYSYTASDFQSPITEITSREISVSNAKGVPLQQNE